MPCGKLWAAAAALLALALAWPAWAGGGGVVEGIEIMRHGVLTGRPAADRPAPQTSLGKVEQLRGWAIARTTDRIPCRLGMQFGVIFKAMGQPGSAEGGGQVELEVVVRTPGLRPPDGTLRHEERFTKAVRLGEPSYAGFAFDEPWELAPGQWTVEFWWRGRRLAAQRFTVYQP